MPKNSKVTPNIKQSYSAEKVKQALEQLESYVFQILESNPEESALIGIQTRGVVLAQRLARDLKIKKGIQVPVGAIDITLYRDDYSTTDISPIIGETQLDFDIDNKKIILIDDVLFTGRTIRAALDEIIDFGRPQTITLAVLVDRGHRELPIQPDFTAMKISTLRNDSVSLHLEESDGKEEIVVYEGGAR